MLWSVWNVCTALKIHMRSYAENLNRAARLVVPRVRNQLCIEARKQSTPVVRRVVRLQDVFARITQCSIAEQEAQAAHRKIVLVIALDGIRDADDPKLVLRS